MYKDVPNIWYTQWYKSILVLMFGYCFVKNQAQQRLKNVYWRKKKRFRKVCGKFFWRKKKDFKRIFEKIFFRDDRGIIGQERSWSGLLILKNRRRCLGGFGNSGRIRELMGENWPGSGSAIRVIREGSGNETRQHDSLCPGYIWSA